MQRLRPVLNVTNQAGGAELTDASGLLDVLPGDIVSDASRRLLILAAALSVITLLFFAWGTLLRELHALRSPAPYAYSVYAGLVVAILVAGLVLATRVVGRALSARELYRAGLAYTMFVGLCAALANHASLWGRMPDGWSGITIIMILFPIVVPVTPRRALTVGLMYVGVDALAFALMRALGHPPVGLNHLFVLFRDDFGAIFLSLGVASIVSRLGLQVVSARRVGSYTLERLLGQGGMGEVWRGTHRWLARPAAIKLIRGVVLDTTDADGHALLRKRFELEVQSTAALRSPHTVDIYDFGVGTGGTLYYVMELLDGQDLERVIRDHGRMPPSRVVMLLLQVCHSLREAHQRGLIHRDLKPSNLFLCRYGVDYDFIKVLDFGLVKVLAGARDDQGNNDDDETGDGARDAAALTASDALTGTPAYMAPEQASQRPVDARTDIYLLGCVAYFLLTGTRVFPGPSAAEVVSQHLLETPTPPSARVGAALPEALDQLILDCLRKQPDDRPPSIDVVAARLRELQTAGAVGEPWSQGHARAWWARAMKPQDPA